MKMASLNYAVNIPVVFYVLCVVMCLLQYVYLSAQVHEATMGYASLLATVICITF